MKRLLLFCLLFMCLLTTIAYAQPISAKKMNFEENYTSYFTVDMPNALSLVIWDGSASGMAEASGTITVDNTLTIYLESEEFIGPKDASIDFAEFTVKCYQEGQSLKWKSFAPGESVELTGWPGLNNLQIILNVSPNGKNWHELRSGNYTSRIYFTINAN